MKRNEFKTIIVFKTELKFGALRMSFETVIKKQGNSLEAVYSDCDIEFS